MIRKKTWENLKMLFAMGATFAFLALSNADLLFAAAPTVTTDAASFVTKTTATLNGTIDSTGGYYTVDESGFDYGLTSGYGSSVTGNFSTTEEIVVDTTNIFPDEFAYPFAVATDSFGNVYVGDSDNNRVVVFDSNNNFIRAFGWGVATGASAFEICTSNCQAGILGSGNGQFNGLGAMAIDSSDNIFVSDFGNNRIQKFNSSGVYQSQFGTTGSGDGQFDGVGYIGIDSSNNIFVSDQDGFGNNRIQKFDSSGNYLAQFNDNGNLYNTRSIEVDDDGYIYVLDCDASCVKKFDSSFGLVHILYTTVVTDFYLNDQDEIVALAPNADTVFIVRQQAASASIANLTCGTTYHYRAFATNADGTSYGNDVTFTTSACEPPTVVTKAVSQISSTSGYFNALQTSDGVDIPTVRGFQYGTTTAYGSTKTTSPSSLSFGEFAGQNVSTDVGSPTGVARDALDNVYIAAKDAHAVHIYGSGATPGTFFGWGVETGASQFEKCTFGCMGGISGDGDGQLSSPEGIAIDYSNGDIYVSDTGNDRIQVFSSEGDFIRMFGWGVDTGANALEVCTSSCEAGMPGSGSGQFNNPTGIILRTLGGTTHVFVVDTGNHRIQKLTTSGVMVDDVGGLGSGVGQFNGPTGVGLANVNGDLFIADTGNNRIQLVSPFDLDVQLVTFTGLLTLSAPSGVAFDSKDQMYIADTGNNRLVYATKNNATNYEFITSYGSVGGGIGQFDSPRSLIVSDSNRIILADSANNRVVELSPVIASQIKPLICGTTYHYRPFATNSDGTGYGADQTFRTLNCGTSSGGGGGPQPVEGCTDPSANNYNSAADTDDGSCAYDVYGCIDYTATNYDPLVTIDDGSCVYGPIPVPGCTNPSATNYNPLADTNDGSCVFGGGGPQDPDDVLGCTDTFADNYNILATADDGSCEYSINPAVPGCTNPIATNYNPSATVNNGSCIFPENPPPEPPIITTIVEVVETITGMDREEQVNTYKDVAVVGLVAPSLFLLLAERAGIASAILRLWNLIPTLLGFRRRRRPWGTVYDSVTKQPLDPVYVTLRDMAGSEISTSITDLDGRYGFITDVGEYKLDAKKGDYIFPSIKMQGQDHDDLYQNLYFGEKIEITDEATIINKNIPMDAVNFNWNEFEKAKNKRLMKFFSKTELFLARIARVIFVAGFVSSILLVLLEPRIWNYFILGLYVLITILIICGVRPRKPGFIIESSTGYPLSFAIVTVFSAALNREFAHTIVGKTGKYHMLVPKGNYYLKIKKKISELEYEEVYTSDVFKAKKGYIDKVIKI